MLNPVKVSPSSANVRHVWRARTYFWLAGWFHTIFSTLLVKTRHGKTSSARIRVSLTAAASKLSASPPSKSEWSAVSFFLSFPMICCMAQFKNSWVMCTWLARDKCRHFHLCFHLVTVQYRGRARVDWSVSFPARTPQDLKLLAV